MTVDPKPPTVRRRRLAQQLRAFRDASGLTQQEVADRARISKTAVYFIEKAARRPGNKTIDDLLDVYNVTGQARADVLELWRTANTDEDITANHTDLPRPYTSFMAFEAEAATMRTWQGPVIPGLLQTARYAAALFGGSLPMTPHEVDERVRIRLARQEILTRKEPLQLHAIIDEAALHRQVGGAEVMREQLEHLADVARRDNITLHVVPFTAGSHAALGGTFVILGFTSAYDRPIVYTESPGGEFFFDQDADVRRFERMFANIRAVALSPDATLDLIATLAQQD